MIIIATTTLRLKPWFVFGVPAKDNPHFSIRQKFISTFYGLWLENFTNYMVCYYAQVTIYCATQIYLDCRQLDIKKISWSNFDLKNTSTLVFLFSEVVLQHNKPLTHSIKGTKQLTGNT